MRFRIGDKVILNNDSGRFITRSDLKGGDEYTVSKISSDTMDNKFIQVKEQTTDLWFSVSRFKLVPSELDHTNRTPLSSKTNKPNGEFPMNSKNKTKRKKDALREQKVAEQLKQYRKNEEEKKRKGWEWEFTISSAEILDINEVALTLRDDRMVAWILPKAIPIKKQKITQLKKKPTPKELEDYRTKKAWATKVNKAEAARVSKEAAQSQAVVVIHRRIAMKAKTFGLRPKNPVQQLPCGHYYVNVENASHIKDITEWIKGVLNQQWMVGNRAYAVKYPKI